MKKRKGIVLSIVITIILIGITLFGFLSNGFKTINIINRKKLGAGNTEKKYVTMIQTWGDKDKGLNLSGGKVDGEIRIYEGDPNNNRNYAYSNGYCMNHGATFWGWDPYNNKYAKYSSTGTAYGDKGGLNWLFDNMILFSNENDEKYQDDYIKRLSKILYGDINKLENYDEKKIFCAQQYAVWCYTNNFQTDNLPNDAQIKDLVDKLLDHAGKNSNYTGYKENVQINTDNAKLEKVNGKDEFWAGPYKITSYGKIYKLACSNEYVDIYASKDDSKGKINNSYRTDSGDIYIKISGSQLQKDGNTYKFNANIKISCYRTTARYWTCAEYGGVEPNSLGMQPVVTLEREPQNSNVSANVTYKVPEGKYHINLVKKATWDTDTDSKEKLTDKYKNSIGGAKFKITQNAKNVGVNVGKNSNEDLTSVEGTISTIAFANNGSDNKGNITINDSNKNTPDEYEITETEAPAGYFNEGRTLKFKVYKTNDYKIKGISVGDSTKVWEYTGENMDYGGAIWIRIDKDGNVIDKNTANKEDYVIALDFNRTAITITYKDPPEGSYRLHIAKKPSNSVSENEYKDCLGGAEFVVKQNRNGGTGDYNLGVSRKTEDNDESAFDHDPDDVVKPENRIVRTVSGKLTEKIAFGNHGSSYLGDIKVNEDNCNTEDIYTFKETKAPFGYTNERIGLKIGITKKLTEDKKTYVIDKIKYYGIKYNVPIDKNDDSWADDLNNVITEISPSGDVQWLKIGKDGSVVTDDNDCIISLDFHNTAITVTYKDKKIEGNYDISLAKYNSDDVEKMTSQKDYDSLKNVSGIKFNVSQISQTSRIYTNTVETKSKPVLITNERKYSRTIYYKKW